MATLLDSFTLTNSHVFIQALHPSGSGYDSGQGQSFTTPAQVYILDTVKFRLENDAALLTGTVVAQVYAHGGVYGTSSIPTGSALAESDSVDVTTIPSGVTWITFTFSGVNRICLSANSKHVVVIISKTGNWSSSNSLKVHINTAGGHSGNRSYYDSGSWKAVSSQDVGFYVYGVSPTPATPTNCTATCLSATSIKVTWTDNAINETAYYVERDDGGWHVISGALPANTQTYTDNTAICDVAYTYRVRAYNNACGGVYSGYCTVPSTVLCPCPPPPPTPEPEVSEKQHITNAVREWEYDYVFKHTPTEKVTGDIVSRIEETKPIKSRLSKLFKNIRRVKAKVGQKFAETKPISSNILLIKFAETSIVNCGLIKNFEESKLVTGNTNWVFTLTAYTKIVGKITSREKEILDELKWL